MQRNLNYMNYFNNRRNQNGFMLIEVIIAVTILGIASIPLLTLQANIINNVWQQQSYLEHLFVLKNLFFKPELQELTSSEYTQARSFEQKDASDFIELKYSCTPISDKSELVGNFPNLYLVRSSGLWHGIDRVYEENLVSFVYIAPIEESKK